jgi:hypothetical protein
MKILNGFTVDYNPFYCEWTAFYGARVGSNFYGVLLKGRMPVKPTKRQLRRMLKERN